MSAATKALWKIAARNLGRNRRRNLATGSAIALGFAALLALAGYIYRVENYLRVYTVYATRTGHIAIYKKDGLENYSVKPRQYSLDPDELTKIEAAVRKLEGIELHGPQLFGMGLIGNGCKTLPFFATGVDPELDRRLMDHPEMQQWARDLRNKLKGKRIYEYPPDFGAIGVSEGLARLLGKTRVHSDLPPGSPPVLVTDCLAPEAKEQIAADANVQLLAAGWSGMLSAIDGEIVMQFNTGLTDTNNSAVLATISHLRQLLGTENATSYSLWLEDPTKISQTADQIRKLLSEAGVEADVYVWTEEALSPMYVGTMEFLYTLIGFISAILGAVIVLSIFNAATMTVIERSQEVGMLRSLGYTRREVRLLFVREGILLALCSLAVGGVIGGVGLATVNLSNIRFTPPGIAGGMQLILKPSVELVILAAVVTFFLAVMATYAAVRRTAGLNIAFLLRGVQR